MASVESGRRTCEDTPFLRGPKVRKGALRKFLGLLGARMSC